jgi:hypothetical protein
MTAYIWREPEGPLLYEMLVRRALMGAKKITYGEQSMLLAPHTDRRFSGPRYVALHYVLADVARFCLHEGLPNLTALVVRKKTGMSGHGWFTIVGYDPERDGGEDRFHTRNLARIRRHADWPPAGGGRRAG